MNKALSTILIAIAILALAGGIFFAGTMYARANAYGPSMMFRSGWSNNGAYGPGMMGWMMGGYGIETNPNVTPLTVDQARQAAEKYIQSLNITGLETGEIMIFDNNAYVVVKESETGLGAFELLVDPVSQSAYPEYGPDMMWNLKYGGFNHNNMMGGFGGMMGGGMLNGWNYQNTTPAEFSADMKVTSEQAIKYAQTYLDYNFAGATAAADPTQFYGYYTLDFEKDGKVIGMLSVDGYNGQIFLHTWHGTFIEESESQ